MSTNQLRLICPNLKCRAILTAPVQARGKAVRCGQCGMRVRVPEAAAPVVTKPSPAGSETGSAT